MAPGRRDRRARRGDPPLSQLPPERQEEIRDRQEFWMYIYSVSRCTEAHSTKKKCPRWHKDKQRRRDPRAYEYHAAPCPRVNPTGKTHQNAWSEPSQCSHGDNCESCHTNLELWYHPEKYKTEYCLKFSEGNCNLGDSCTFAHSRSEFRDSQMALVQQRRQVEKFREMEHMKRQQQIERGLGPAGVTATGHSMQHPHAAAAAMTHLQQQQTGRGPLPAGKGALSEGAAGGVQTANGSIGYEGSPAHLSATPGGPLGGPYGPAYPIPWTPPTLGGLHPNSSGPYGPSMSSGTPVGLTPQQGESASSGSQQHQQQKQPAASPSTPRRYADVTRTSPSTSTPPSGATSSARKAVSPSATESGGDSESSGAKALASQGSDRSADDPRTTMDSSEATRSNTPLKSQQQPQQHAQREGEHPAGREMAGDSDRASDDQQHQRQRQAAHARQFQHQQDPHARQYGYQHDVQPHQQHQPSYYPPPPQYPPGPYGPLAPEAGPGGADSLSGQWPSSQPQQQLRHQQMQTPGRGYPGQDPASDGGGDSLFSSHPAAQGAAHAPGLGSEGSLDPLSAQMGQVSLGQAQYMENQAAVGSAAAPPGAYMGFQPPAPGSQGWYPSQYHHPGPPLGFNVMYSAMAGQTQPWNDAYALGGAVTASGGHAAQASHQHGTQQPGHYPPPEYSVPMHGSNPASASLPGAGGAFGSQQHHPQQQRHLTQQQRQQQQLHNRPASSVSDVPQQTQAHAGPGDDADFADSPVQNGGGGSGGQILRNYGPAGYNPSGQGHPRDRGPPMDYSSSTLHPQAPPFSPSAAAAAAQPAAAPGQHPQHPQQHQQQQQAQQMHQQHRHRQQQHLQHQQIQPQHQHQAQRRSPSNQQRARLQQQPSSAPSSSRPQQQKQQQGNSGRKNPST